MATYQVPYGNATLSFHLADNLSVDEIIAKDTPASPDAVSAVRNALQNSTGARLEDFSRCKSAAIAVNDKTRPVPHEQLLPPLLEHLEGLGISPKSIHLIIATGTHVPTPREEFSRTLPPWMIERYEVSSHNCDDRANLVSLGVTSRRTPVSINHRFMEADLKIVVGNIEPHHFMGFSGGAKTAAIGLAGRETITRNHAMLPHPKAITGHYEDNPMRMDVEEIGKIVGVNYALNAILNLEKEIVTVVAGSPEAVMRVGIPVARDICQVRSAANYDLVIASAGGYPKDINFYQAQKALTHAALVVKPGGVILLVAECSEGSGSQAYEDWMIDVSTQAEVFQKFERTGFQIGPHKAFQVARIAGRAKLYMVSGLPEALVKKFLLTPAASIEGAIQAMQSQIPANPRIALMPFAVNTVPMA